MWINGIEVVISQSYTGKELEIKVVLEGDFDTSTDDFRELFNRFANAFCGGTSEENLNKYWDDTMNDVIHKSENEHFECAFTMYEGRIELIVFEG